MNTLVNFRDLGGTVTQEGLKLKSKRLLRAGELVNLCEDDLKRLTQEFDLKQIIDFRSLGEMTEKPDDNIEGVQYLHIDVMGDNLNKIPSLEVMMEQLNPEIAHDYMKEINRSFITLESAKLGYQQFFRTCLNQSEGAILFHCFAGKDRTGFGAALLMKALGVSTEDIMLDYLKTIEQRAKANEIIIEGARRKGLSEENLKGLEILMTVQQDYLEAAFESIEQEYGDFEGYLKKGLEITEDEIKQLKQLYLEM